MFENNLLLDSDNHDNVFADLSTKSILDLENNEIDDLF